MKALVAAAALVLLASCTGGQQKSSANDALLTVAVKAKLAGVDVDSATAVNVAVSNGDVTLAGRARNPQERDAYVGAARSVNGVTGVNDRLTIDSHLRGLREQSSDAALAARVSAAIAGQAGVNVFNVKVTAQGGVVTLRGTAPSASVAHTVVDAARGVAGVREVRSNIAIRR